MSSLSSRMTMQHGIETEIPTSDDELERDGVLPQSIGGNARIESRIGREDPIDDQGAISQNLSLPTSTDHQPLPTNKTEILSFRIFVIRSLTPMKHVHLRVN